MKSLLRSVFVADAGDNPELLLRNYQMLNGSALGFEVPEYNAIWAYIQEFVRAHSHIPNLATLRSHFEHSKEDSVLDQLRVLEGLKARTKGDFQRVLEDKANDRRQRVWAETLKEASIITSTGMEVADGKEKKILLGPIHSARYVMEKAHDIVAPTIGGRLSGEVTKDGVAVKEEYERVEADPLAGIGQFCFLQQCDDALGGAKRHELWIHAAFTGGMKSTFMLNWAYNQAVIYKHNVLIFSLEMPYGQCRRILYAIHSMHPKFREIRMRLGIQTDPEQDVGLPYQDIRDGKLHEWNVNAKAFYFDYVIPDFNGEDVVNHPYLGQDYAKIHIEVADPDKDDFTMHDLRSMAEVIYSKDPFSMVFVDHCGLMSPRRHRSSTTENLNEVIRDLKKLALGFNRGQGMAVVGLFQISREGYKSALKTKEKTGVAGYNLTHLSYANEAERCVAVSSTFIRSGRGIVRIDEVSRYRETVWSGSGWKQIKQVFDNGVRRIWDVTTDRGSKLGCTASHRVRVVQDGQLGWQTISNLSPGKDYVASTFGEEEAWPSRFPALPDLVIGSGEKPSGQQGIPLKTPAKVTRDLAYLLGAWDGDGKTHPRGLGWTGNRKETAVRDRLHTCFEHTFGHTLPLQENPSRSGSFELVKWSQPLKRWFETVAGKRAVEVPTCILQAPREIVCAYLQGLFDTDGWVNNQGVVGINMKGACEDFLRQVQLLLTALGIDSDLSKWGSFLRRTGKTYPKVLLRVRTRESAQRFHQDIGFSQEDKQAQQVSGRESRKQVYPVPHTFLSAFTQVHPAGSVQGAFPRSFYNLPAKVRKTGLVPRSAVELLVQHASEKGIGGAEVQFLRRLLTFQVMRVVSVVDTGRDEPVMDLEVDGDHEYQTGPVLSHNSADVVTSTWIDDELKAQSRVQFNCLKSRDQAAFLPFIARVEWPCRRLLSCFDVALTPEENAKIGAAVDKAAKEELETD